MRILYVCRLFSGLADGIRGGRWDPRGVPTVYRLLEALDKSEHDLRIVFTVKDDAVGWPESETRTFPIEGFGREITVIPQRAPLPAAFGRARGYLREIDQYREIRRIGAEFAPDIAYFDRVNIYQAALNAGQRYLLSGGSWVCPLPCTICWNSGDLSHASPAGPTAHHLHRSFAHATEAAANNGWTVLSHPAHPGT
jgi:hypothetical protein